MLYIVAWLKVLQSREAQKRRNTRFAEAGSIQKRNPSGGGQININKDAFVAKSERVRNHTCVEQTMLRTGPN